MLNGLRKAAELRLLGLRNTDLKLSSGMAGKSMSNALTEQLPIESQGFLPKQSFLHNVTAFDTWGGIHSLQASISQNPLHSSIRL